MSALIKKVAILGSTGSVGQNTIDVVSRYPYRFNVVALAAKSRMVDLAGQVRQLDPEIISVGSEKARLELLELLQGFAFKGDIVIGDEGLLQIATLSSADVLMIALVGSKGLAPLMAGIKAGKEIAFVNKEALVMGGPLVIAAVRSHHVQFLPVDSEHSAIFQCLLGENMQELDHMTLTSSGGPFRTWTLEAMSHVTPEQAIKHPCWNMGKKISVDSATLMNKGLEVIEAKWLFDVPLEQIRVMIHPESIVHSMVAFKDGSFKAHLGTADMRIPILYALTYPERFTFPQDTLDLAEIGALHFEHVDEKKFKALPLCREACRLGGSYPAVVNATNEIAVEAFLQKKISFLQIVDLVEKALESHESLHDYTLEDIVQVDEKARRDAFRWVEQKSNSFA